MGLLFLRLILTTLPLPNHHRQMKFPSIKNLAQSAASVLKRFTFEMLFALMGAVAGITYTEINGLNLPAEIWCMRFIMTANLGLLVSLATTLYCASKGITAGKLWVYKIVAALAGFSLIFLINPFQHQADYIRFFLMSLSLHLLVAFAAFIKPGHIHGFWQFNKTLFLRFLTGALYSAVLFGGISAAIGAMNFLFNFKFEWDAFVILWILIAALFNTLFFLAGVPENLSALDEDETYPKGLKIFTQYVLIPLATLYVVILLAYEIKIAVQWDLPKGLVSNLILGYAVFGILSVLLVFPIREQSENKWIKTYARSFYFLMIPLLGLLFLAVGTRVFKYGITEDRYFLILLACWLLFITIYFLVSRKQNIKLIPISLCVLTLLSIYGPQGAFSVSMYSQRRILVDVFKKTGYFKNDKLMPVDSNKIPYKQANAAVNQLSYLVNKYDLNCLQPYIGKDLTAVEDSLMKLKNDIYDRYNRRHGAYKSDLTIDKYELLQKKQDWIKKYLNLGKFSENDVDYELNPHPELTYHFTTGDPEATLIKGYDIMLNNNSINYVHRSDDERLADTSNYVTDKVKIRVINKKNGLTVTIDNEATTFDLKELLNSMLKDEAKLKTYKDTTEAVSETNFTMPQSALSFTRQTKSYTITLVLSDVLFDKPKKNEVESITNFSAKYLLKHK